MMKKNNIALLALGHSLSSKPVRS